jgi:hypothetical protein
MQAGFEHHPEAHKGMRGPGTPIDTVLQGYFCSLLGLTQFVDGYCCFQLCVSGEQLVYHSDERSHAAIIYLTPNAPPSSGTSFFKSKATGLRAAPTMADARARVGIELDEQGAQSALLALEANTYGGKLLDRTAWEEVDRIGNVFNRLTVWNAKLIHAATDYFGTDLASGRLFQMFFFNAR